jgi:hypothetical protein
LQDLIFLTQHIENFAVQILGIADGLIEVVNLKNQFLPFPFNIPVSDLDVIKESFGIKTQYYVVSHGKFRGRYVRWSGGSEKHLMIADIFGVYESHSLSNVAGDRPSLSMRKLESIIWFFKKHGYHLVPKFLALVVGLPLLFYFVLFVLPFSLYKKDDKKITNQDVKKNVTVVEKNTSEGIKKVPTEGNKKVDSNEFSGIMYYLDLQEIYIELLENKIENLQIEVDRVGEIVSLFEGGFLVRGGRKFLVGDSYFFRGFGANC